MTPEDKNDFEERLLTELRQVAAERPAPEPAPTRSMWRPTTFALGGGGVAAAAAVIAIVAGSGGGTSSAYAVEKNPDGEVTVKIESLKDAAGLETKLREAGVPAVVNYAPGMTIECAEQPQEGVEIRKDGNGVRIRKVPAGAESVPSTKAVPTTKPLQAELAEPLPEGAEGGEPAGDSTVPARAIPVSDDVTFTVDPQEIKEGDKLYVTKPTRAGATGVAAAIAAPGEAPGC